MTTKLIKFSWAPESGLPFDCCSHINCWTQTPKWLSTYHASLQASTVAAIFVYWSWFPAYMQQQYNFIHLLPSFALNLHLIYVENILITLDIGNRQPAATHCKRTWPTSLLEMHRHVQHTCGTIAIINTLAWTPSGNVTNFLRPHPTFYFYLSSISS